MKIRLQQEAGRISNGIYISGLATGKSPTYANTLAAFGTIARTEGIRGLYRGVGPTTVRAALLTAGQVLSTTLYVAIIDLRLIAGKL